MSKELRLPWLRQRKKSAPELPLKAPIELGPFSNGEAFFAPDRITRKVERLIFEKADEGARRHNIDRREFLASTMGMATSLWAINMVTGCSRGQGAAGVSVPTGGLAGNSSASGLAGNSGASVSPSGGIGGAAGPASVGASAGRAGMGVMDPRSAAGSGGGGQAGRAGTGSGGGGGSGGFFDVPRDPTDLEKVCEVMRDASKEFIFDIQTHHVNRADTFYEDFLRDQQQYTGYCLPKSMTTQDCFARNEYVRLMFLESDTTVAVLSGLPAATDTGNPITNAEIAQSRDAINMMADGTQRLVNHHMVLPNKTGTTTAAVTAQLDEMQGIKEMYKIGAWKCYPAWSPNNTAQTATDGYFLDDPATGLPFITKGIELGVPLFCIHKGLPIPGFSTKHLDPVDIGRVAKMFPMANFVVYHSGYGNTNAYFEGPYQMNSLQSTNALVTSVLNAGVGPNQNVYAELGTTWQLVSTPSIIGTPTAAAHVLGKLLKYIGENNVVWGTDSIWYGSPQSQIERFLQFQIPVDMQMQYGYPALTMEIKRKVLGLNAARIYGVDPTAMRCGIDESAVKQAKRQLDYEHGGRRWVFNQPMLRTRRDFWRILKQKNFEPG